MTRTATHLYLLTAFHLLSAVCSIVFPRSLCQTTFLRSFAAKTGLDPGAPSLGWQLPLGLQALALALVYAYGARNNSEHIRILALLGNAVFVIGIAMGVWLAPDINGGAPLVIVAGVQALSVVVMGLDVETREVAAFVTSGMRGSRVGEGEGMGMEKKKM